MRSIIYVVHNLHDMHVVLTMRRLLREIFEGSEGRLSSKRIMASVTLVFALVLTIFVVWKGYDTNVLMYPYTLVGGLLGFGVFEKKK